MSKLTAEIIAANRITEQEQRNASLRQHIADLEASGAVMERVTLYTDHVGTLCAEAWDTDRTVTSWEGQS